VTEIRWDALTGRPVVVAEARAQRPNEYAAGPAVPPAPPDCPFCEGNESTTPPEVTSVRPPGGTPNGPGWTVRAFANKFPTVAPTSVSVDPGRAPFARSAGTGAHEVVVLSPAHDRPLAELTGPHLATVFRVLRDRVAELERRPGTRSVVMFENAGPESGGTLWHPHAQLVGLNVEPPHRAEERAAAERFAAAASGACLIEATAQAERQDGSRVVAETAELLAYAPFASPVPYAARLVPAAHAPSFSAASDAELARVAELLPRLVRALRAQVPRASYNWTVVSVPGADPTAPSNHWRLDLLPRLVRPDGFEIASGVAVNPLSPEEAARRYRAAWAAAAEPLPGADKP